MGLFVELQRCGNVLDGVIGLLQYRDHGYSLLYMPAICPRDDLACFGEEARGVATITYPWSVTQ